LFHLLVDAVSREVVSGQGQKTLRLQSRSDVLALLGLTQGAFQAFDDMPKRNEQKRIFLLSLVFHGRWKR